MLKEIGPGFRLTLAFTVVTGLLYPAVMTGLSELIFPNKANGSLVTVNGKVVGSSRWQRLRCHCQRWHKPGPDERQADARYDQDG